MFPVGGVGVMLLGAVVSGALAAVLASLTRRRLGWVGAVALAGLLWTLVVIALVTLIPADGAPGIVSAEGRLARCSTDFGGPAPDGFWVFSGGQRLLNVVVFVPSGVLLVVAAATWGRTAFATVPLGLVGLAAYSIAIELTQLGLARLDRACDVTDMVDNAAGAVIGVGYGIAVAMILRPWRGRHPV